MLREHKAPLGPRPADFPTYRQQENCDPVNDQSRIRVASGSKESPTLRNSTRNSRNNYSLSAFGDFSTTNNNVQPSAASHDFLPSVNFDDLHSSIVTASNVFRETEYSNSDYSSEYESMTRQTPTDDKLVRPGREPRIPSARSTMVTRPMRTSSLARRQSTSTRQSSMSSTASAVSTATDSSSTAPPSRARRQPQYPPIAGSGVVKGSRKSIGPFTLDLDVTAKGAQRNQQRIPSTGSLHSMSESSLERRLNTTSTGNAAADGARLASARAAKTKSMQPQLRPGPQARLAAITPPERARASSFTAAKSPGKSSARGALTPSSSAKRMSMMPGMPPSSSHATGLGARTVSPTDARRMRRLSTIAGPPPMPFTPPTSQTEQSFPHRASSKSPSSIPRKISTPSSSRTTPEPNRKSYSSGLSIASSASFNTAMTSTGSLQPRLPQGSAGSRLPTLKTSIRSVHSSAENEGEEVPPVPAIPKAYESPKDSPQDQPFFVKQRKSSLAFDSVSIGSTSTGEYVLAPTRQPPKSDLQERANAKRANQTAQLEQTSLAGTKRKNLQPMRLPPLNLLPLSTPTAAKVAALPITTSSESATPPPRRANAKTPSTPMTASKTAFFSSRNRSDGSGDEEVDGQMRSSTSVNHTRGPSTTIRHVSGAGQVPFTARSSRQQTVSPFLSSSLPKSNNEFGSLARSNTIGDMSNNTPKMDTSSSGMMGHRSHAFAKDGKGRKTPVLPGAEEPQTPTSTSIRRKLSMGWKRTASKSSINLTHDAMPPPQPPKHDNMPPPRLPASATMNSLSSITSVSSTSPSAKSTNFLESKKRKTSISSLNMFSHHNRQGSDNLSLTGSPKKDAPTTLPERPKQSSRTPSSVLQSAQKLLISKGSSSTIRSQDPWTSDLDRDDISAEDEMKKLASRRKETESAARQLDALRKRAVPKERVSPQQAVQIANLNIYERGEIIDYKDIYFCGTVTARKHVGDVQSEAANFGYDDERGDYSIIVGDHLSYRYEIVDILGKGSFGQVVRCVDHKTGGLVAIKIIRNKKRFHQQALVEVNILKKLREWDPENKHSMVSFTQSFYFRGHLCISTELLDMNLYEFIKSNGFRGFSLKLIRRFTKQLLSSLLLLKQHKVIHCDLKPENILLAHPMHSEIKVIDFGSSCFENEKVYTYIQSRFYRSPEVILGMTYGMPIDMWSVGCILAELFTGYPIFPGENEQEQLACIMEVFGPPEKHLIEKSTRKKLFFDSLGKPRLTVSSKGRRRKPSSKTLQQVLKSDDEAFLDFLTKCLRWDPDRRLKPEEAVRHEFLTGMKSSVPRAAPPGRTTSPLKRYNAIIATTPATTTASRPLPDPPATSFKNGVAMRAASNSSSSPVKPASGVARRQSAVANLNAIPAASSNKRVSIGGVNLGSSITSTSSALPRVSQRIASNGYTNAAHAGASAAMRRA